MPHLPNATTVHAVYATASGNTELVVEKVRDVFFGQGVKLELHRAESTPIQLFIDNRCFLLATSTWEHGVINPLFTNLLEEIGKTDMSGKQASIIGCGDIRYEPVLFCEGAKTLKRTFLNQGGTIVGEPLFIDGDPYEKLDLRVAQWASVTGPLYDFTD